MTTQQDSVDVERLRDRVMIRGYLDDIIARAEKHGATEGLWLFGWQWRIVADALSLPITQRDEQGDQWRAMADAPRDGRYILAVVAQNRGRYLEHQAGRMFVIRHEGVIDTYDMGWAVYPGFGGCSDHDFAGWMPAPQPPAIRRLSIEQGDQDRGEG